ncbi:hypothetical protein LTR66_013896 [Elasticomyces elasticus]|nr:hypothetical protein LTR66_013896 [Elasticomyces elasticus]
MATPVHTANALQEEVVDRKGSMTPSPNASSASNGSVSRRPPRKSTLTQQQKNQKRQRATQDQLLTLEVEFNKNPTPTAAVREKIAQEINMTERSVQIWFQNRRAKIKNIAKKSIESGEDCDIIPDSMRRYLAMQALESGKGGLGALMGRNGGFATYGGGALCLNADSTSGKVGKSNNNQIAHCKRWLTVQRSQSAMDLVIFYSPEKACLTYYINNDSAGYKIEYPFAWIKNITLDQGDTLAAAEGASQRPGGLVVELTRPPKFYMDSSGSGGFYECGDFTEDQQASKIMVHHLGGHPKILSGQLAKLVSLESFHNRHALLAPDTIVVSAPVSPIGHRPASQPNHFVHPHSGHNMFPPDSNFGLMGPPGPRGHKRQRSRSVPVAVDFSMLRHPMPSFLIQPEPAPVPPLHQPQQHTSELNIFAPIPQHQLQPGFAAGPIGPSLSIDTSAGYGLDYRQFGGPMSATTVNSPSDYGTPAFFTSGLASDMMNGGNVFSTPYNNGFLSVDPAAMIGTSNTPLSMISHGDPVIADQSPPLNGMGRNQGADVYGTSGDPGPFSEDGISLNDMYNKNMSLPFRSPLTEEPLSFPNRPAEHEVQLPFRGQMSGDSGLTYQSSQDGSNVAFRSPPNTSHMHRDASNNNNNNMSYQNPHDHVMSFQSEEKPMLFQSPPHMQRDNGMSFHHSPRDAAAATTNNMYQSPMGGDDFAAQEELDMHNLVNFGTLDPTAFSPHHTIL